jgi:hypothetical protein
MVCPLTESGDQELHGSFVVVYTEMKRGNPHVDGRQAVMPWFVVKQGAECSLSS